MATETEWRRRLVLEDSITFTRYFFKATSKKRFLVSAHHLRVCEALDKVVRGEITKLIINIAPRYGKTELVVKSFIARGLAINPMANFIHLSYSSSLATDNSEAIKDIVNSDEYKRLFDTRIKYGSDTKNKWKTEQGGGVYATSTLGQITGFGAGLVDVEDGELGSAIEEIGTGQKVFGGAIVIDDPIKPEDALSDVIRERVNRRFETTIRNRVNSRKTPIIIIMQRLHEHDLCGYLQEIEPGDWTVVSLPCIVEDEQGHPQPLWPFKHSLEELEKIRNANSFVFETQYMQNPKPLEGLMYEGFKTYETLPIERNAVRKCYIDTADTGSDFLCAIFYVECADGCYVTDILYTNKSMEYTEVETAKRLAWNETQLCVVESNNGGRGFRRNVERNLRELGCMTTAFKDLAQTANKKTRIFSHSAEVQNMVYFPTGWETRFAQYHNAMAGYRKEGNNAHDDAPDATTGVVEMMKRGRKIDLGRLNRLRNRG